MRFFRAGIFILLLLTSISFGIALSDAPFKTNARYDYVIIAPNDTGILSEAERLAEIKWGKGLKTTVVNLDSITNSIQGFDEPCKIRNFLKTAFHDWQITWALILGDYTLIPARKIKYDTIPTDFYYACLDGEWSRGADSLYGYSNTIPTYQMECHTDSSGFVTCDKLVLAGEYDDVLPDIYIGRLPVANQQETKVMVDKIIRYGDMPQNSLHTASILFIGIIYDIRDYSPNDAISIASSTFNWHYSVKGVYTSNESRFGQFNFKEMYEDSITPDGRIIGDTIFLGNEAFKQALSEGHNLVYYMGHGGPRTWQTCSFRGWGMDLSLAEVKQLVSPTYSNIVTISCTNMGFENDSCIAKEFLVNPNGGAISFIGSTGFLGSDETLPTLLSNILAKKGINRVGQAFWLAQVEAYKSGDPYCRLSGYQFWGDPELEIWTRNITSADQFQMAVSKIDSNRCLVSVLPPLDSVLICMYKKGEIFKRDYSHNGNIVFDGIPFDLSQVAITATRHDYLPSRLLVDLPSIGTEGITGTTVSGLMVNVSPNPFCRTANISCILKPKQVVQLDIMDIAGKKLFSKNINRSGAYQWYAHTMPSGLYFLTATIEDKLYSKKLILLR